MNNYEQKLNCFFFFKVNQNSKRLKAEFEKEDRDLHASLPKAKALVP